MEIYSQDCYIWRESKGLSRVVICYLKVESRVRTVMEKKLTPSGGQNISKEITRGGMRNSSYGNKTKWPRKIFSSTQSFIVEKQ